MPLFLPDDTPDAIRRAMEAVDRRAFVDPSLADRKDADHPLPIGEGQTISQPYIVAKMLAYLKVGAGHRVLEVGAGSGYVCAVLAELGAEVTGIEYFQSLADEGRGRLADLGYEAVDLRQGDGADGCPEKAPFDRILVSCAAREIPPPLLDQLVVEGLLVIPLGGEHAQELVVVRKGPSGTVRRVAEPVRFVPLL